MACLATGDGDNVGRPEQDALIAALFAVLAGPVGRLLVIMPPAAKLVRERVAASLAPCYQPGGQLVLAVEPLAETDAATSAAWGDVAAKYFDAILCLDPAWGRCAVEHLHRVRERLRLDGILVLAGLVHAEIPATPPDDGWPVLSFLQAQVQRCGFGALNTMSIAEGAGLDLLPPATPVPPAFTAPRLPPAPLVDRSPPRGPPLATPGQVLPILAHCRAVQPPRWALRPLEPSMVVAMRRLFAAVFAPNAMTAEGFEWKYGSGRGLGMTAWRNGELVAFYGGLPRRISCKGRETQAMQIVDVMVHGNERGILRRQGAFFQTAATFIEAYVGYGTPIPFGFGFPTERHHQVAERLGFYVAVDQLHELSWPCQRGPADWRYRLVPLEAAAISGQARNIDHLWAAMRLSLPRAILGVRDARFIRHRYLDHPSRRYEYRLLRRTLTPQPLALLVLAIEDGIWHLRDYVGDPRHLPAAIRQLRRLGADLGHKTLVAWITTGFLDRFPTADRNDQALGILIPHNIWTPGPPAADMRGCWWLMGGDTDFL